MLSRGKKYPLAVKLGTITADGADVYSYADDEDDSVYVLADRLTELLAHWGVDTTKLEKTEKAMQELELQEVEEALWRRRERIPKNATHYVWAYQLQPWEVRALTHALCKSSHSLLFTLSAWFALRWAGRQKFQAPGRTTAAIWRNQPC